MNTPTTDLSDVKIRATPASLRDLPTPGVTPHQTLIDVEVLTNCPNMCSGHGQFHTNEADPDKPNKTLQKYIGIDFEGIRALVNDPQRVEKAKAQWVIPSTLMSRSFKKQEAEGMYWMLWADIDKNPPSLDVIAPLMLGHDYEAYTSRSATPEVPKCRILIPFSRPLSGSDWVICQEILNDILEAAGITPDRASERPAQLCYLPNYDKFYDCRYRRDGVLLNPLVAWEQQIAAKRKVRADKARELVALSNAAIERRAALSYSDTSDTIGAFNRAYSIQELLLKAGYDQQCDKFRHPRSESGSYSASVKDDRVHSLSSNDPLYTGSTGGGAHDGFSVFTVLWAHGDRDTALKLAGDEWLKIGDESWNKVKQREFMQSKALGDAANAFEGLDSDANAESIFDDLVLNFEDVKKMADAEFLIPNMIVRGHVAAYVSPGNGGKTTIFIYLCERLAAMGLKVLYINVDGSPGDLKRHHAHSVKHRYDVISPDAKEGKSTDDFMEKLETIAAGRARYDGFVFIIDTLKKFLDVIDKKKAKEFYRLMRAITLKGATICLLGHTNKYAGDDGKQIFEGTADLRNDLDELIYLDSAKNETNNTLEVTTRPDKVRAEFEPRSFVIRLDDDRKVIESASVINILSKDTRELLELIKDAIREGNCSQKDIMASVKNKTEKGDRKIREILSHFSHGTHAEIQVEATGRGKDLHYSLPSCPFDDIPAKGGQRS